MICQWQADGPHVVAIRMRGPLVVRGYMNVEELRHCSSLPVGQACWIIVAAGLQARRSAKL